MPQHLTLARRCRPGASTPSPQAYNGTVCFATLKSYGASTQRFFGDLIPFEIGVFAERDHVIVQPLRVIAASRLSRFSSVTQASVSSH